MKTRRPMHPGKRLPALIASLLVVLATTASATEWTVDLTVTNGGAASQLLTFGIHPEGTYGVDPQLGEVGLPPWPPTAVFDARFMIEGIEGLRLDIRSDAPTERVHVVQWQPGEGGYPVVVRWDAAGLPLGTFTLSDGYTGTLIPPFDMAGVDSLLIPPAQSFIKRLYVTVLPGTAPPAPPEITPPLPDLSVYEGQQFPELHLDEYVVDPDNADAELQWLVLGEGPPWLTIDTNRVLHVEAPPDWIGAQLFTLRVVDPGGLDDQQDLVVSAVQGGLPNWTFGLTVQNAGDDGQVCVLGLHPDATDGIDHDLGEVALPPWPPTAVFEARWLLPDSLTASYRDLRASGGEIIGFHLQWQAGEPGYPVTVSWPGDLPPGDFSIQDDLNGTLVPPTDMRTTQSVIIPESLDFLTGLLVTAQAVVDTTPPQGPERLIVTDWIPGVSAQLDWSSWPCIEDHFDYYEILYDTHYFQNDAAYTWDWDNDPTLKQQGTTSTTIPTPPTADGYVFRIRAWDTFGNVGPLSRYAYVGTPAAVTDHPVPSATVTNFHIAPNPFNPLTTISFNLSAQTTLSLSIYDLRGHLVRDLFQGQLPAGPQTFSWDGRSDTGSLMPSGTYLCRLNTDSQSWGLKLMLLR